MRHLFRVGCALVGILSCVGVVGAQTLATGDTRTVTEPVFPAVCTTLTSQMAIVNGAPASETAFDTARIQAALTACPVGQAVELAGAAGNYAFLFAPLNIPTGVSLIVDGGVTMFASRNREDYQTGTISSGVDECGTQGPNGNGCKNMFNFANGGKNANSGIYGYGVIDARGYATTFKGGADTGISWWKNSDVIASGYSQNNPLIMKLSNSTNFTLYKITLKNAPEFHVGWSGTGFTAWGVKIITPFTVHNSDGIDPSGTNVTITNSSISDGDDDVAVGASNASANITVSNVNTYSGHGISVGSYTQGGLTNFLVTNVNMAGTITDGNATGIRLKSALDRGGLLKQITYQNMCLKDMHHILQFTPFYNTNSGTLIPSFQNIVLSNVHFLAPTGTQNPYLVQMQGYDANHASTITLNNVVFDQLSASNVTPTSQYEAFTLQGNVYPAFLQSLPGTGVTYSGTATSTATGGVSACTGVFPYIVGELYASTATATNLQTASISKTATVTLNAMIQPAMSTVAFSGSTGTWTGAATLSQPIQFFEGATQVGSASVAVNGTIAAVTLSNVTPGTHVYTAKYPGDSNYSALTFGSVTVNVSSATTATTTALTAPATATYGASSTLSAAVTAASGTPTGTVAFYDGTSPLGTGTLASGTATLAVTLPGGSHTLSAIYSGDATFVTSTSSNATTTVSKVNSTAVTTANPTTVSTGASTTLTATITGLTGQAKATGTVSFADGTTALGNAVLNSSGVGVLSATLATAGTRTITASYNGDGNYNVSSATTTVTVIQGSTTTVLTAPATVVYGNNATLSAKVTASVGTPTGTVTFYDGTAALGTGTLASGSTSLTGVSLLGGAHSITAAYSGDATNPASTSAVSTLTVTTAPSSTVASAQPSTVTALGMVNLTATVNGVATGISPVGTVTFLDGATVLGTGDLTAGVATLATPLSTVGNRTITMTYPGDTNYAASSGTTAVLVTAVPTTTTLTVSPTSVYNGSTVTLTATVSQATSGTVTFLNGATVLATATVGAGGVASTTYTVPGGLVGTIQVTASYAAAGIYSGSLSAAQGLTIVSPFAMTNSSPTINVGPGASGTVNLVITPGAGYTGTVTLACSAPVTYVTCSTSVPTVTLNGTSAATVVGTIKVATTLSSNGWHSNVFVALGLFGLVIGVRRRKSAVGRIMLMLVLSVGAVTGFSGCSSGSNIVPPPAKIIASQVTFTATASGTTATTTVVVNIQ